MENLNLKKIGSTCKTFKEFREKLYLLDKLYRLQREQPHINHHTKQQPNIRDIAKSCSSFSEFHAKTSQEE